MDLNAGLVLRPWSFGDAAAVVAAFATADMAQQAAEPITDEAAAVRWLEWATRRRDRGSGWAFAVTGDDDIPVANMAVTDIDRHDCGWVSYWVSEPARGLRVASDALRAVVRFVHEQQRVVRLELGHRLNNPASGRVAVNAGFGLEGVERGKLCYGGERFDVARLARLAWDPCPEPSRPVSVRPADHFASA